jgi:hypothetical protein
MKKINSNLVNSRFAVFATKRAFKKYRLFFECEIPANKIHQKIKVIIVILVRLYQPLQMPPLNLVQLRRSLSDTFCSKD